MVSAARPETNNQQRNRWENANADTTQYDACLDRCRLIGANAERIIWGTDWPHPDSVTPPGKQISDVTPLFQIDDGWLLNQLPVWAPDAATRKRILVDNPTRLYGF